MSLSLDQLFQSPNEEKKVQLQNRPFIGDESSDECSDDEKTNLPHQSNKSSSSSLNYKNEHILKNDINNKIDKQDNKNDLNQKNDNHSQFLNQLKEQTNQLNYASFSSNQILRNSKEMSNNNLTNNNYSINYKSSSSSSSNKQNERIKFRKLYYNDEYNDYEQINKSDHQQDNLLNDYKNELSQNEIKNQDQNDLINHKPASALIKKGDLFKNVDYFNKNSINDLDDDLYSNRKIERRKVRKNSLTNYQQQQQKDILQQAEFELNKNKDSGRIIIDKRDTNNLNRVTRYENKQRNYHHYIHKDKNSKRASISSAEISKYDTLSSSSSASPTQDLKKQDLNDIICIENKQYKGYELEDVLNIDNQNRMKNLKDYSQLNSNSLLDDDLNKIKNSQSNQKLTSLNDLLTIESDNLNKNLISDVYQSNDFSSSFMHKSTKSNRKSSIDKSTEFNLVDLNINKNELSNLSRIREPSPELLKFNDEDFDQKQFMKNVNIKSDLLTDDDDNLKNFTTIDNEQQSSQINLISSTSSFLQPKIINTNSLMSNINDNNSNSLINDLNDLNELNDLDEPDSELKDLNDNNNELINQPQINNNINELDELDKDDGIGSDGSQNDLAIAQPTASKTVQLDHNNRRSSGECSSVKDLNNCKEKETKIIYSNDLKMNSLISSQLDSSTNSESSFNSTVMSNRIKNSKQNTNLTTESNSPVTSLDGQLSPKRNVNLKTPGYTQRILNSNNEKIKYGLFQLGTNNVSNSLIDMDMEPIEADRIKEDELNDNEKLINNTIQKDISRDDLVKSILNIPFSSNYDLDQNEDDEPSSLNSSLNSSHKASQLKSNYLHFNNKQQQQELQYISNDLENLNLNSDKSNFKEHTSSSSVTNRNASLGDIRLNNNNNNSSGCKQIKESNSVNSQLNNLNNNQNTNFNNVNNKNNSKNRKNNLINSQSINDHQDLNDCLDLVLDKSLANNINFVSNSMSNSSLLNNNKSNKMANGRLPDYMLNDAKNDELQKEKNLINNEFNKKEENDKKDRKEKIEKDNKMDKEELLIDTSDLIGSTNITSTNQPNNNQKYFNNNNKKESSFDQHQIQSKILQETVTNHLLSDSLVDVSDDAFNSNQFESNNKKSTHNKHFNDLCYLDNTHNRIDKNSSRNIINSKYNNHNKTSEDSLRNFSLSPETTDCDSIIESEFSISSFVSVPGGLNQMPILEDGLSSCSESDTETQTIRMDDLMKKQKHHHQQKNKLLQQGNESPDMELFPKCRPRVKKNQHLSDYDMNSDNYNSNQSNLCDDRDNRHLKKSRSLNLNNNNNMHLSNGLDSSEEHANDNLNTEQLWNQKIQSHQTQQQNRGHYNQSIGENQSDNEVVSNSLLKLNDEKPKLIEKTFHEDDCDTDQETDRLLGAQRTEDKQFFDERVQTLKKKSNSKEGSKQKRPSLSRSVLIEGVLFRARYLGSTQLKCEGTPTKATRMLQAEEAVSRIKAPEGEAQPSTEVDLFISTEKIMVLNTDLKEIMMDHSLRTISYIADIGDLLVLMARRRQTLPNGNEMSNNNISNIEKMKRTTPLMICHVFESDEAQYIAQSIGQAFQVAYMEFLKANGIEDSSFIKEMDYQEVLNSQEIFGNELEMFARKEKQKEVIVPKKKGEILGIVIVESGWGSMLPTCVVANMAQQLPAARCGAINIGDQIIAINGISLVGLPLSTCQNYIKNAKNQTAVKLTIVPCAPVVEVKIKRPDTKYQLGFSVQNGVICSLLRGGIAERGGVRVGHRIIEINGQSVVAVVHDKIVNLLATSVGEIHMKTMPTSMFRLLTAQDTPIFM